MNQSTRWFRRFLKLLPADFQADYARDMERTFRAQHRDAVDARGVPGVIRLWWETLSDLLRTAPRQHLDQIRQDVRYAVRTMGRRPGFTTIAVLVFALGIGATTAVFSVVDAGLLRPVPFDDPHTLVAVRELTPQETQPWELSYPAFVDLRREAAAFEQVAAHMRNGVVLRSPARTGGAEPRLAEAVYVSANLLDTLRVQPIAGRGLRADEDVPGAPRVALVSQRLARSRFASLREAIGESVVIDDEPTTIVGVLPATFRFPAGDVDLWLPIGRLADQPFMRNREVHVALVVARLHDGMPPDAAGRDLADWFTAWQARAPGVDVGHRILVRPLHEEVSGEARPAVMALAAAVLLLLVVTCTSGGLLLLTRAAGRSQEVSIRLALGASRARIARQLLTETTCLAAAGALLGVAAARMLLQFLVAGLDDALPPLVAPEVGRGALAAAIVTASFAAAICGLAPLTAICRDTAPHRSAEAPRHLSGRWFRRPRHMLSASGPWREALVVAQVAMACVLVVLATLLGRSLEQILRVDPGFQAERLLVMRVNTPGAGDARPGDMIRFYDAVSTRLRALPGVAAVTATSRPPVRSGGRGDLTIEGQSLAPAPVVTYRRVLPGFFSVLGIPLMEGREFTDRDGVSSAALEVGAEAGPERVVIVSATLARRYFPAGRAVGRRIKVGPPEQEPWTRIVGVAGDVHNGPLDAGPDLATYEPYAQQPWNGMFVMVRTAGDPQDVSPAVQRALRELEPDVIVSELSTMERQIDESVASRRFHATLVGGFAGATLVLVALALHGVVAFQVTARTREIGIRAAVGASSSQVLRHVMVDGLRPVAAGVVLGLAGAVAAASGIRALLFRVTPADVWIYATSVAMLTAVALLATWLPARRAAQIDPSVALRAE